MQSFKVKTLKRRHSLERRLILLVVKLIYCAIILLNFTYLLVNCNPDSLPRIKSQPNDLIIFEGDTSELSCVVEGLPMPEIEWFKDGKLIEFDTKFRLIRKESIQFYPNFSQTRSSEELPSSDIDDLVGVYYCLARNSVGQARSRNVSVKIKPAKGAQKNATTHIGIDGRPQTGAANNQFKYHLNHLRPPSLVPITIQQSAASQPEPAQALKGDLHLAPGQQAFDLEAAGAVNWPAQNVTNNVGETSDSTSDTRLLQLQLPLQLHLKLRPLPLPLPPPSSLAERRNKLQPELTETTTIMAPLESTLKDNSLEGGQKKTINDNLLASTWSEAKRILLLSAMSPSLAQNKLNRRSLSYQAKEDNKPELEVLATTSTSTSPPTTTTTTASTSTTTAPTNSRRQRHSSQLQSQGYQQLTMQSSSSQPMESRIQAMAAAMLPFFWPSFHLSSSALNATRAKAHVSMNELQPESWPTIRYKNLDRFNPQRAGAGEFSAQSSTGNPVHADPATKLDEKSLNKTAPSGAKRKRRRPIYLTPSAQLNSAYPDSTRLASKYPMPKIKFQRSTAAPLLKAEKSVAEKSLAKKHFLTTKSDSDLNKSKRLQLPEQLSKLIESQLQANGTSILMKHKQNQTLQNSLAPTTSVSKVIRLKNDTDLSIVMWSQPISFVARLNENKRELATVSSYKAEVTTLPPTIKPELATGELKFAGQARVAKDEQQVITTVSPFVASTSTELTTKTNKARSTPDSVATTFATSTESSTTPVPSTTSAKAQTPKKFGAKAELSSAGKNIKLFHFKRKPDMKKLPFYKKPLNYTELGWTAEQIQEHQRSLKEFMALGVEEEGESGESAERREQQGNNNNNFSLDEAASASLLKRKRRGGKSQFERLMAELLGGNTSEALLAPSEPAAGSQARSSSADQLVEPAAQEAGDKERVKKSDTGSGEDLVPAVRKKAESLVMKPMFFVMKGRRRANKQSSSSATAAAANGTADNENTTLSTLLDPTTTTLDIQSADTIQTTTPATRINKGKPIIRMRRKHNGDQPALFRDQQEQPWRPSKPFSWLEASAKRQVEAPNRLILVPSALLTPSGSQLMPLYEARPESQFDNWRALSSRDVDVDAWRWKPSGGLAPTGDEAFLLAPNAAPLAINQTPSEKLPPLPATPSLSAPAATANVNDKQTAGELRVPKLLVKPMRPAKYSLNGYIPKPSLNQQQQSLGTQATSQRPKPKPNGNPSSGALSSKDLDSSTSNEIFSRRRGLQQHQRNGSTGGHSKVNHLSSFSSLLENNGSKNGTHMASPTNEAILKQMEENKRKYIIQHQQLNARTHSLSVQKVNQIKAKLGLIVSNNSKLSTSNMSPSQQAEPTINSVSFSNAEHNNNNMSKKKKQQLDSLYQPQEVSDDFENNNTSKSGILIGAPLNSIPKTDFECTNKMGKFITGLFADQKTGCQVWHLCSNNRKYSFLCPSGTIFNAKLRICDWRYNVKCENDPLPF